VAVITAVPESPVIVTLPVAGSTSATSTLLEEYVTSVSFPETTCPVKAISSSEPVSNS
jgi:hypothetical protein